MTDDALALAEARIKAAGAAGLPIDMAKRLRGATAGELKADAEALAAAVDREPAGDRSRPADMNAWIRESAGR